MSDTDVKEDAQKVAESQEPKEDDKHPETVPWSQYVGIKEKFTRVEKELTEKVSNLEEQLKKAPNAEEHGKIKEELDSTKTKLEETTTELTNLKEATVAEKRDTLIKRGVPEEKVKELSAKELDAVAVALGSIKPQPDLGNGEGVFSPSKARDKISQGFETLHPQK